MRGLRPALAYGVLALLLTGIAVFLRAFDLGPPPEMVRLGVLGVGSGLLGGLGAGGLVAWMAPRGFRGEWFAAATLGGGGAGMALALLLGGQGAWGSVGLALPWGAGSGGWIYALRVE